MFEKAEAAGAHPALTQAVIMQWLVMPTSRTKKARIPVSALLPQCQGSRKYESSLPSRSLYRHDSNSCVQVPGKGGKVRTWFRVMVSDAVKG